MSQFDKFIPAVEREKQAILEKQNDAAQEKRENKPAISEKIVEKLKKWLSVEEKTKKSN